MSLRVDKYSLFTKSARKFGPYLPEMVSYFLYIDQEYIVVLQQALPGGPSVLCPQKITSTNRVRNGDLRIVRKQFKDPLLRGRMIL